MSALTKLSLKNRALVALISITIVIVGLFSMVSLRQELIPDLELPGAVVVTTYPGASPEVVQEDVTKPIEKAANGLVGLKQTTATSRNSVSVVTVQLEYGTDMDEAVRQLRRNVDQLTSVLPKDSSPQVITGSMNDLPVVQMSVTSDLDPDKLAAELKALSVPDLQRIPGVRSVDLVGTSVKQVVLHVDQMKLAMSGMSIAELTDALENNGIVIPAGNLSSADVDLTVEVGTRFATVDEIADVPLINANAEPDAPSVRLGDVATVNEEAKDASSFSRTNGKTSIGITVTKGAEGNTVEVSDAVAAKISDIEKGLGNGAEVRVTFDQAPFITDSIEGLSTEGLLGLAFAVLVILLFLLAISPTIVSAISIPLSLLIAMIGLNVAGYTLNILTLGALTVAIGRVVDDSIVVIENIQRHLSYGGRKTKAILDAVKEVAGAVTASTLTTISVFLPIGFVAGQIGELFRPFALTVGIAMAASWVVALTIVPVLAYWFIRAPKEAREAQAQGVELDSVTIEAIQEKAEAKERKSLLQRGYMPILRSSLKHPIIIITIAVVLLAGTVGLSTRLETTFLGDMGQNTMAISMKFPAGTPLAVTDEAAGKIEDVLSETDGVETYQATIGGGGMMSAFMGGGGPESASFSITTALDADPAAIEKVLRTEFDKMDDIGTIGIDSTGMGMASNDIQVIVQAPDEERLATATDAVLNAVKDTEGMTDVTSNMAEEVPTLKVTVDRDKAAALGLNEKTIGGAAYAAINGLATGTVTVDHTVLDTVISLGEAPTDAEQLAMLPVGMGAQGPVVLAQVASIEQVDEPTSLTRSDGEQAVTISATPTSQDLSSSSTALQASLDKVKLPEGAVATISGVVTQQGEAFAQLGLALLLAIAIVYLVMVATFKSLIQPLILLISIPFAATGALLGLLMSSTPLGVAAIIGLLMLIGIVVTNAIVLIDLINQYRNRGLSAVDAIIEGGRHRLRPILMTAAATIFALIPMAIGITGGGVFISKPLAIVVIGGLISSTLLTLILVPVLYELVERMRGRGDRKRRQRSLDRQAKRNGGEATASATSKTGAGKSESAPDGSASSAIDAKVTDAENGEPEPGLA